MAAVMVSTKINGDAVEFACPADESLLTALRDRVGLTGVKEGCGTAAWSAPASCWARR
jgi:carbon-monoxide dehydrogenase small subunit